MLSCFSHVHSSFFTVIFVFLIYVFSHFVYFLIKLVGYLYCIQQVFRLLNCLHCLLNLIRGSKGFLTPIPTDCYALCALTILKIFEIRLTWGTFSYFACPKVMLLHASMKHMTFWHWYHYSISPIKRLSVKVTKMRSAPKGFDPSRHLLWKNLIYLYLTVWLVYQWIMNISWTQSKVIVKLYNFVLSLLLFLCTYAICLWSAS